MTLTKTDRARVTHAAGRQPPPGLGPASREGGRAATEPTAPTASRNTVPTDRGRERPGQPAPVASRVATLSNNPHDSRQRISRLSHR